MGYETDKDAREVTCISVEKHASIDLYTCSALAKAGSSTASHKANTNLTLVCVSKLSHVGRARLGVEVKHSLAIEYYEQEHLCWS